MLMFAATTLLALTLAGDPDGNGNGVPNECECAAEIDGSGDVGVTDFLQMLAVWGTAPGGRRTLTATAWWILRTS